MTEQGENQSGDRPTAAAAWVARLHGADVGEGEWLAFDSWLEADPTRGAAYDQALALWQEFGQALPPPTVAHSLALRRLAPAGRWLAAAAAIAATLLIGWMTWPQNGPAWQILRTGKGEMRTASLPDGSQIVLAADTDLSVRFDGHERRVSMVAGEAQFDVARDVGHPFIVTAGDRQVRVVGTAFDIRQRGDRLTISVQRGEVEVGLSGGGASAVRLLPGRRLDRVIGGESSQLGEIAIDEIAAWRGGRLIYRDRPLNEVVADLNAQFSQPISLADRRLAELRFSGVLVLDDEDSVVRRLTLLTPLWSSTSAAGIMLRAKEASAQ